MPSCQENFVYQNRFKIIFGDKQFDNLDRKIISVTTPNIAIGYTEQPTNIHKIYIPGDSLEFGEVNMEFLMAEDLSNYKMILNWMNRLRNFTDVDLNRDIVDITIMLLDSKYKEALSMVCKDCFPYNMSDVPFDIQIDDTDPIRFTVTFKVNGITYS
jgi:hypothetical protein